MLPYHVIIITCWIQKMAVGKILFTIILVKSGLSNLQNSALIFLECQKGLIVNNEIWFAARLFRWISLILQVCSSRSEKNSDGQPGRYSSVREKKNPICHVYGAQIAHILGYRLAASNDIEKIWQITLSQTTCCSM